MHWIIQKSLFKPNNYELLCRSLERLHVPYTAVTIPPGTYDLQPDVAPDGKVYVCGALKMARIARDRGWEPGSFLNANFHYPLWVEKLGTELLNHDFTRGKLSNIALPDDRKYFIRPVEDNKAFDGAVFDDDMLTDWRRDKRKASIMGLDIMVSSVKALYREYRIFIVKSKVITGSLYKAGGQPDISGEIEPEVKSYAERIIQQWLPCESVVMDVALTGEGYKVIEFNNINSSSFYACDVQRYIQAIESAYSDM